MLIRRGSDPVFGDIVLGDGLPQGQFAPRTSRPRHAQAELATNRGRGRRQGEVAAVQLVKHADAEPAAGLRGARAAPGQTRRKEVIPATLSVAYTFAALKTILSLCREH